MRLLKHRRQKREPAKLDITAFMNLMIWTRTTSAAAPLPVVQRGAEAA